MAYPYTRKQFDASAPLFAVRDFAWDGERALRVGDRFDPAELGAAPHRVSELWSQRFIDHEQLVTPTVAPAEPVADDQRTAAREQPAPRPAAREQDNNQRRRRN